MKNYFVIQKMWPKNQDAITNKPDNTHILKITYDPFDMTYVQGGG